MILLPYNCLNFQELLFSVGFLKFISCLSIKKKHLVVPIIEVKTSPYLKVCNI